MLEYWWQSPAWFLILFCVTGLIGAITGVIMLINPKIDRKKEREESIELAKHISSHPQRVEEVRKYTYNGGFVTVRLLDDQNESDLRFPTKHPDFFALCRIRTHTVIQFELQEEPILGVEKQDAVAYLRLKT